MKVIDTNAYKVNERAIDAIKGNLDRVGVVGAQRLEVVQTESFIGESSHIVGTLVRSYNAMLSKAIMDTTTKCSFFSAKAEKLSQLSMYLSRTDPKTGEVIATSSLVSALDDFLGSAVSTNPTTGTQGFISKAQKLVSTFSVIEEQITKLEMEASSGKRSNIEIFNATVEELFSLNDSISKAIEPVRLHDKRDSLLEALSSICAIDIQYGEGGRVSVQSKGADLLRTGVYSQIREKDGELQICSLQSTKVPGDYRTIRSQDLSGGALQANDELHNQTLPEMREMLHSVQDSIKNAVNRVHNDGVSTSVKSDFTGERKVKWSDINTWSGEAVFTPVSANEDTFTSGAGPVLPVKVNLGNIVGSNGARGNISVADMAVRLNQELAVSKGQARVGLGDIVDSQTNLQIPNTYLVNNVQMVGDSNIVGGQLTFSLKLDGNDYFGSKVDITGIVTDTAAVATSGNVQMVMIGKGEQSSSTPITLSNIPLGLTTITVTMRVTGKNGVISTGTVNFTINPGVNANLLNKIASGTAPGGQAVAINAPSSLPFATVNLVNEHGAPIPDGSDEAGYLSIQTVNGSRLAITSAETLEAKTGESFGSYFGLNNFFTSKPNPAGVVKFEVSPEIAADPNKLAANLVINAENCTKLDARNAYAKMEFAANLNNAETVTINGTIYTFRAIMPVPSAATDVLIDLAGLQPTLVNLVAAVTAKSALDDQKVTVTSDANSITVTAKTAGSLGNELQIAASVVTTITSGVNLPVVGVGGGTFTKLGAGSDETKAAAWISASNFANMPKIADIKSKPIFFSGGGLPEGESTLHDRMSFIAGKFAQEIAKAENMTEISKHEVEFLEKELNSETGIKEVEEFQKLLAKIQQMYAISYAAAKAIGMQEGIMRILFG